MTLTYITTPIGDKVISALFQRLNKTEIQETKTYLILSTPRVGSNLLCQSLENTEVLGSPSEWFNPLFVREIQTRLGHKQLDFKKYTNTIKKGSKSSNGVFGIKVHIEHYTHWIKNGFDILDIGFDAHYYIERKDKIAQAYSLAKAKKTNFWTKAETPIGAPPAPPIKPVDVAFQLLNICSQTDTFETKIARRINRRFDFNELILDDAKTATLQILSDLNIKIPTNKIIQSNVERQSGSKRGDHITRIKKYFNG